MKAKNISHPAILACCIFSLLTCRLIAAVKEDFSNSTLKQQIAGKDSVNLIFHDSPKYFIIEKQSDGNAGADILVKFKPEPGTKFPQRYIVEKRDLEIKNEYAEYYADLKGDMLILNSTTGPDPSGLIIWNLAKHKKVFTGTWSDPQKSDDNSLIYWLGTGKATEKNCPEYKRWKSQGLDGAIETRVILDLKTLKIRKTKETRCAPRQ